MHSGSSKNRHRISRSCASGTNSLANVRVLFGLITLSVFNALI